VALPVGWTVEAHVAEADPWAPRVELEAGRDELVRLGAAVELCFHRGGHLFTDPGLPDFDAAGNRGGGGARAPLPGRGRVSRRPQTFVEKPRSTSEAGRPPRMPQLPSGGSWRTMRTEAAAMPAEERPRTMAA